MEYKKLLPLLVLAWVSCGQPVPAEKSAYVGEWRSQTMQLLIAQDGSVKCEQLKAGATTSVTGPLQKFEGNNFTVGIGPIATTFVVSKPPYQENGEWKMVVDDVELTKVQ